MLELIYPVETIIPTLPAISAQNVLKKHKTGEEMFPVVDETGLVTAQASRSYCHSGSHLLHPVVHLHIIDRNERLYLQKRSMKKELLPGKWDTAVGGHVIFGESIIEALMREASEELNLTEFNPIYLGTYKWETERDAEFVNIFAAVGSYSPRPDKDEVDEGKWWTMEELDSNLDSGIFTPNFVTEFQEIRHKLLALL